MERMNISMQILNWCTASHLHYNSTIINKQLIWCTFNFKHFVHRIWQMMFYWIICDLSAILAGSKVSTFEGTIFNAINWTETKNDMLKMLVAYYLVQTTNSEYALLCCLRKQSPFQLHQSSERPDHSGTILQYHNWQCELKLWWLIIFDLWCRVKDQWLSRANDL